MASLSDCLCGTAALGGHVFLSQARAPFHWVCRFYDELNQLRGKHANAVSPRSAYRECVERVSKKRFVTGHDFSRAVKKLKWRALAPVEHGALGDNGNPFFQQTCDGSGIVVGYAIRASLLLHNSPRKTRSSERFSDRSRPSATARIKLSSKISQAIALAIVGCRWPQRQIQPYPIQQAT